jgi:predicted exporter
MKRGGVLAVALWLLFLALAALVVGRAHYVADLTAFLPAHPTPAQQLLVDQLRDGPASRLILCAIEGGDAASRARLSKRVAERLRADPEFSSVANGTEVDAERDRQFLFTHRYALSPAITPARFSTAGLAAAIQDTLDDLASPAGMLLEPLLTRDPTGETLQAALQFERLAAPHQTDGVWTSADASRALLVLQTRAAGSDTDAQQRAMAAIAAAFAAARSADPGSRAARIELRQTGPGVFAVRARSQIQRAVVRLSLASSVLIVLLLLVVYRSLPAVLLGLVPVGTGALAGVAAVAVGFGTVHGITLGFGITLIGEAVDYSIYFLIQSREAGGESSPALHWRRKFWPTVRLGVLTSICGFASLLASGFPGLAQLGAYSISGLAAAALVTRFVLPELTPRRLRIRDVAPVGLRLARLLGRIRHPRTLAAAVFALAAAVLAWHPGPLWSRELAALSPVPRADQAFDATLRTDLGSADVRDLVVVSGPDLEAVLAAAERAGATLERQTALGLISGFDSPALYLPSLATQEQRRRSLPDPEELKSRLHVATRDLAVDESRLAPFVADVAAARDAKPIGADDLAGTSLATGFGALILHEGTRWNALLPLHAPTGAGDRGIDVARLAAALRADGVAAATVLDLKQESDALYASYLAEAIRLSVAGFAAIVVLLAITLRSALRVLRVLLPLVIAVLCAAAVVAAAGIPLTLLHLVGMLLVVAVGSNYALFFDHGGDSGGGGSAAERTPIAPITLAALGIANLATVIGFGLLSLAGGVPVLEALGMTVAPGALFALLLSALLAVRARDA